MSFRGSCGWGAFAVIALIGTQSLYAAKINVTHVLDELSADGHCSLREAIQAANTDSSVDTCAAGDGADTIGLPMGTYLLTIAGVSEDDGATGDLDITSDLTLEGAGAANNVGRSGHGSPSNTTRGTCRPLSVVAIRWRTCSGWSR
jgi:CSLREA domain-containing protein